MLKYLPYFLYLLSLSVALAQPKYTISGTVSDAKTGEALIGATLFVKELPNTGTTTNTYGFYSLTLPKGNYTLGIQYIGFDTQALPVTLTQTIRKDVSLRENESLLQEVNVKAEKANQNVTKSIMGVEKLNIGEINKLPVLLGERDVLKAIQLLPGVKNASEGSGGLYVRGGNADQNLILLDDAPVYNAYHLLGFFSTFNSDAIKDLTLYKGSAPAEYGGRLSSVIDIKMNEGNNKGYEASGGIGLIASHLNVEGPIVKDKGSFLLTGRRTYADLFLKLSSNETLNNKQLYFYDLNAKANYKLNNKNQVFLSGYLGRDVLNFDDQFGLDWGNSTGTLRWNHLFNEKLFSNTSVIFSDYSYQVSVNNANNDFQITSRIQDWNLKHEFQYFPNPANAVKIGINSSYHTITPGQVTTTSTSGQTPPTLQDRYGWENAVYASNDWKANNRLTINYGLRLSSFSLLGAGDFYSYDADGSVVSTQAYTSGQVVKNYLNLEPRLSASFLLNSNSSLKASYTRNTQNMHIVSNSTSSNPTDLWIMSSNNVKPQIADQVAVGYFQNLAANQYEFSSEIYYKKLKNQLDLKQGADIRANDKIEGELLFGVGRAYGVELLLRKRTGRLTGWLGYTLSRTEKQIDGINDDQWFAAKQDQTHDVSLVGIYEFNKRWTFSGTWVYKTGNAVTFPSGKYQVDGTTQYYYTERNGYRMPAYHRLDFSATYKLKQRKRYSSELVFGLYNAYGRENPYSITFEDVPDDSGKTQAVQTSLFKQVPSITWNFKFN